ncbi:heterokaryon incompatibility protein-domain-containing protein [Podospora fimiseda]|uniref:Heterokaryon incompatibility protein-domain-containing protein n=1 Tax=Podospora fimiseda TaxID=252190 RepID=A0AAN7BVC0_9PEZI|nr:heterokaryon incompatibility protein-domain-containing protein [Podospora fimiseda]
MATDTTSYVRTIPNNYRLYTPLKDKEIRLLRVCPASNGGDIPTCYIYRVNITHKWTYSALSYCWGDLRDTKPIKLGFCDQHLLQHDDKVHHQANPTLHTFNATRTLHNALEAFQLTKFEGFLWVDALCINQGDVEERSYQVKLMKDIYQGASAVEVWLGGDLTKESEVLRPEDDLLSDSIITNLDQENTPDKAEDWANQEINREEMSRLTPQRFTGRLNAHPLTRFVWVILIRSGTLPIGDDEESVRQREEIFEILVGKDSPYFDSIILLIGDRFDHEVPAGLQNKASVAELLYRTEELSNNNWFRRIWVIQEVVYSQKTFVRHSNVRIGWFSMMNLVRIGSLARDAEFLKTGELRPRHKNGRVVERGAFALLYGGGGDIGMPRLWTQGLIPQVSPDWKVDTEYIYTMLPSLSPIEVIFQTGIFMSTDPRDRLFGILSLIPSAKSFLPDYTKSLAEISTSFTRWYAQTVKSWDILSLCHPRDRRAWLVFKTSPSWAVDFRHDYGVLPPFALRKRSDNSPMFSAGIAPGITAGLLETTKDQDYPRITLTGCIVGEVVKIWNPMSTGISKLPHPSLWSRLEEESDSLSNNNKPFNPLASSMSLLLPNGPSLNHPVHDYFKKVNIQRWNKAIAGHADKLLRSLWQVYSSSSGFTHGTQQSHAYTTDDILPDHSLSASHLQSSFQTLITGIALVTGSETADAAKLLSLTLNDNTSQQQFPFICTNMASRTAESSTSSASLASDFVLRADDWSLFITDDGRVGIGHAHTHIGDKVLIPHGGSVPYVIREKVPKERVEALKRGQEWELIGECFLEGRMHAGVLKDPLYDDRLDADLVESLKTEEGSRIHVKKGGWRYRCRFRTRGITLV